MSQTKTRGMICSSNVSDKNKGYDILLENLRQKQALWYTPRMSLKKNKGYGIFLEIIKEKKGV
jgi:hypothetical protein